MSEHKATIQWKRATQGFDYDTYNRDHTMVFPGGQTLQASAAPEFKGNAAHANPEQALVAAIASCHMLTFLALAARKGITIDQYTDDAVGFLEKNEDGKLFVSRVTLRPRIIFGGNGLSGEALAKFHERAHQHCFIANSVLTRVKVEPL